VGVTYGVFHDAIRDAGNAAACNASLSTTQQSLAELVGHNWLRQLCLVNTDASKNAQETFILFYYLQCDKIK